MYPTVNYGNSLAKFNDYQILANAFVINLEQNENAIAFYPIDILSMIMKSEESASDLVGVSNCKVICIMITLDTVNVYYVRDTAFTI